MSIQWMNRVWELSEQKATPLLALLAIADNANDYGVAWPGYNTLAHKTRVSVRTIPRVILHLEKVSEIALHHGGGGPRDTNLYVLLVGRDGAEIDYIQKLLKNKYVKMSDLKVCHFVMDDKLSMTKKAVKVRTAMRTEPSINHDQDMNELMNDPLCAFLRNLPGYNPDTIEDDRAIIVEQGYSLEALKYLWDYAQERHNPDKGTEIGLFLAMIGKGQQSPAFLDVLAERKRLVTIGERPARDLPPQPQRVQPDQTVTEWHQRIWLQMINEISFDLEKTTYQYHVAHTQPVSINGSWTIAVPHPEWWQQKMVFALKRIAKGMLDNEIAFEFVKDRE